MIEKSAICGFLGCGLFRKECEVFSPHPPRRVGRASSPGGQRGLELVFQGGEQEPHLWGSDFQYLRRRCITSGHKRQMLRSSWNTHPLTSLPPTPPRPHGVAEPGMGQLLGGSNTHRWEGPAFSM